MGGINVSFNETIIRRNTASIKWDLCKDDVLPLWVADMDFKSPKEVIKALNDRVMHGVYGYTYVEDSYYEAIINWMKKRHNWEIEKDWIVITPGIVSALNIIIQTFTKEGDSVLIQRPVYNPFSNAIEKNNRTLVNSPLVYNDNTYEIDFVDFEQKIVSHDVKLFIMCSPHNPVGRVWKKSELEKIGDICLKHNVLIIVDEIHHDLVFKEYKHIPLAALGKKYLENSITCTAPSKSFNLAGLKLSNIIIGNPEARAKFTDYLESISLTSSNIFAMVACRAAYNHGGYWLDQVMEYIKANKIYVKNYLAKHHPQIKVVDSEATYLMWLDFSYLKMDNETLANFMLNEAKLWLNHGYVYGEEGSGFERLNIATSRSLLEEALKRLSLALNKYQ